MKTTKNLIIILALVLCVSCNNNQQKNINFEVQQITAGPKHHLFGYIGQSLTIPWNESGRYIVSLRTDFYERMPVKGETAEIIILDTQNDYKVTVLDKTLAWNLQQGTMLYWNPKRPETQFFFNDIDPDTGLVFTVLYDIEKRKRIREYRFGNESIANGGVAPNGEWYAGINYGKISRLREIISYQGTSDYTQGGVVNGDNDGLFKVNTKTGKKELLVSYKKLAEFLKVKNSDTYPIYVHHTLWNRDSDRLFFVVRGSDTVDGIDKYPQAPCVINVDGSNLRHCDNGGHPEWYEGKIMTVADKEKEHYHLFDVDSQRIVGRIGDNGVFPKPGGDNAYSPDGKWYVCSQRYDLEQFYTFYRFEDNAHFVSEGIPTFRGDTEAFTTRIDGAPRWNRNSDAILVGGVAEDGTRQMSIIRIQPEN
jgi:hypothetical protein